MIHREQRFQLKVPYGSIVVDLSAGLVNCFE